MCRNHLRVRKAMAWIGYDALIIRAAAEHMLINLRILIEHFWAFTLTLEWNRVWHKR